MNDKSNISKELLEVFSNRSQPNWDGYGAEEITIDTYNVAYEVLQNIPVEISFPTFGAEPDGDITFEWYTDKKNLLNMSINSKGRLLYLYGSNINGFISKTIYFDKIFPEEIIEIIKNLDK